MNVSSVSTLPSRKDATTANGTPIVSGPKTLGSDDFMKLLAVQFQQQDPMKPMDDTAFIAQMAQFTSLSQTQTMTKQITQMRSSQDLATANSYIGYKVTVDNGDGTTGSGVVSGVQVDSAGPKIVVDGNPYAVSSVLTVQPAPAPTSTTMTASANTGGN